MEIEEWKSFDEYPNYEVSNFGRVRSIDRTVIGKGNSISHKKGKLLKPTYYGDYKKVSFSHNHKIIQKMIHVMVATLFVTNPDPITKNKVNHKDGNKRNNYSSNLEWLTHSEDKIHSLNLGTSLSGEKHPSSKLSSKDVSEIISKYATNKYTYYDLAKEYNTHYSNISLIVRGKSRIRG